MNPRARRIRRQRRSDRAREIALEAERAQEELDAFNRKAQRLAAQAAKKAVAPAPPTTAGAAFAQMTASLPKV